MVPRPYAAVGLMYETPQLFLGAPMVLARVCRMRCCRVDAAGARGDHGWLDACEGSREMRPLLFVACCSCSARKFEWPLAATMQRHRI